MNGPIATLEACFVSWEIITIFMAYGKTLFALYCFVNLVQRAYRTNFYTGVSCPYRKVSILGSIKRMN